LEKELNINSDLDELHTGKCGEVTPRTSSIGLLTESTVRMKFKFEKDTQPGGELYPIHISYIMFTKKFF
jgi:hypothetical protein|tara:strand:+ start:2039 stop:2245 length:207 start_codon:yes stop_codon:yes gene_type:complete